MTNTESPATVPNRPAYTLIAFRLGVDAGGFPRTTIRACRATFARMQNAGTADQAVIVSNVPTMPGQYPADPIEYLGRR